MNKCYLGSTNAVKLDATKEVLSDYLVIGLEVDSKVSNQPLTDSETIKGALNRAKGLPIDGLRIGLEAGVHLEGEQLYLVLWGVLIDQSDNVYYAGGTRVPLDSFMKDKLLVEKLELATIIDEHLSRTGIKYKKGTIGFLTNNLVERKDIFIHIVKLLYGQYQRRIK